MDDLARVMPTFMRRKSERKPMLLPFPLPARTHEKMTTSFSLPWNPSTVLMSTRLADSPKRSRNIWRKSFTWQEGGGEERVEKEGYRVHWESF